MDIRQPHVAPLVEVGQLEMIQSQHAQNGCINVMRQQWILHRAQSEFIRRSEGPPALHARDGFRRNRGYLKTRSSIQTAPGAGRTMKEIRAGHFGADSCRL